MVSVTERVKTSFLPYSPETRGRVPSRPPPPQQPFQPSPTLASQLQQMAHLGSRSGAWAPSLGARAPSLWTPRPQALGQAPRWLVAPTNLIDFLRQATTSLRAPANLASCTAYAVPPKNSVPVIVTFEDSASKVTSITHWPVLASGVVIVNYRCIFCCFFGFSPSH